MMERNHVAAELTQLCVDHACVKGRMPYPPQQIAAIANQFMDRVTHGMPDAERDGFRSIVGGGIAAMLTRVQGVSFSQGFRNAGQAGAFVQNDPQMRAGLAGVIDRVDRFPQYYEAVVQTRETARLLAVFDAERNTGRVGATTIEEHQQLVAQTPAPDSRVDAHGYIRGIQERETHALQTQAAMYLANLGVVPGNPQWDIIREGCRAVMGGQEPTVENMGQYFVNVRVRNPQQYEQLVNGSGAAQGRGPDVGQLGGTTSQPGGAQPGRPGPEQQQWRR